ncbi:MAG: iron complex outermembrane receptor protein [Patiriisocius sp.]|jgi:iron complex outermembrane receptor protein
MKILSLIIVTILSLGLRAGNIAGVVVDDSNIGVPFSTVTLNNASDSSLVKVATTNESGAFTMRNMNAGDYLVIIKSFGFEDFYKSISLTSDDLDIGTLSMTTSLSALDEVTVIAEKPMVQILADKTVFNVNNTINATGTSAFELLRKAPGVIIDNDGGIIVEGKSGVQIYIDGKPSVLQGSDLQGFLESLQASDIESIEIITQPSSKYDAAGSAGIVNIVLKKDKSIGTNGSVTLGLTQGQKTRYNSSVSFNSRGQKGNLYGTYSNRFGENFNELNFFREQSGTAFDSETTVISNTNSNNIKVGYDLYATPKSTFGVILSGNLNDDDSDSDARTTIRELDAGSTDSTLLAQNVILSNSSNFNGNLNYRYADTSGTSINMDIDYGEYSSEGNTYQPNFYLNGSSSEVINQVINRQITETDIDIFTFKVDYEQKLLKGIIGVGVKYSDVGTENIFDLFDVESGQEILDTTQSNLFDYSENVNAAYINYNKKWNKWNAQAGLRVENTESDGVLTSTQEANNDRVERSYTDLFPSGGLTYQHNQKNQFGLTYSSRITRPNYQILNPFEFRLDELSFQKGNPQLQPQYTDNVKLSHTFNYRLNTSISYSYVKDFFARFTTTAGENTTFLTTDNVANHEVINLTVSYPTKINDWWSTFVNLSAFQSKYKPKENNDQFSGITLSTLSLFAQNTFSLPKDYKMEVSGWYSSPSVWGGTFLTKSLGALNIAFQKSFMDRKFNAKLSFNDILYSSPWRANTEYGGLKLRGSGAYDSRNVVLSISFKFGSNEIKKARDRKTGLEDEKSRIGDGQGN